MRSMLRTSIGRSRSGRQRKSASSIGSPSGWASRCTRPISTRVGYALVGGRLVAGNEKPTALFMYENADKQRLSLQVRKQAAGPHETAFRYAEENGVGVFYWIDDACGYALSGNVDRAQLLEIAHVVYGQLAAAEAAAPK